MSASGRDASTEERRDAGLRFLAGAGLAVAVAAAYANAMHGAFVYDDQGSVIDNPSLRSLATAFRPPTTGWPTSGRPVFNFTLGVNYAVSQLNPWSYHVLNLLIHLGSVLALFGIVRRTLSAIGFRANRALALGWAAALLWGLHPLLTEAVTYISQRSESLMGLFYLSTLYGFLRHADEDRAALRHADEDRAALKHADEDRAALRHADKDRAALKHADKGRAAAGVADPGGTAPECAPGSATRAAGWAVVSVLSCALGMATKEVMVTAPVVVLLFDRVFVADSWRAALRRRRYYLGLGATWMVLGALMAHGGTRGGTTGFHTSIAWWAYALTQFRGVADYLRLALWPRSLLFSYGLTLGGPPGEIAIEGMVVLGLAVGSLFAAVRGSKIGFLGAWFFLILSPTSTVVPIATELIAEHRVYLSLAAMTVGAVLLADWALRRVAGPRRGAALTGFSLLAATAAAEGAATAHRNRAYDSVLALWTDTAAKAPDDAGALNNLGTAYLEAGQPEKAVAAFQAALALVPGYAAPHFNLGNLLVKEGRLEAALPEYEAAVRASPDDARERYAYGSTLKRLGRAADARRQFLEGLRGRSETAVVWYDLGNAFLDENDLPDARTAYSRAVALRPDYRDALANYAGVLAELGDKDEAIRQFQAALRLEPRAADIHNNLGGLLAESGRLAEAEREFETALTLNPDYREARNNLERVRAMEAEGTR